MINNVFHAFKSPFMLEIFIIKSIRHQQRTIIQLLQRIASVPLQKINIRPFKIFKVYIWVEVDTCVLTNNIKSKFWFFLPSIFKVNKQKRPQELYHLFSGFYEPGWFMFGFKVHINMGHRPHIFFLNIVREKDQINENCVYALAIQSNMQTSRNKKVFFHVEDNIKMSTQVYRIHVDDL